MRLVIARCSVDYEGRLSAHLPMATRLLLIKADGCISIHSDGGAYKPLNWMVAPNTFREEPDGWIVTNGKGEKDTGDGSNMAAQAGVAVGGLEGASSRPNSDAATYVWESGDKKITVYFFQGKVRNKVPSGL